VSALPPKNGLLTQVTSLGYVYAHFNALTAPCVGQPFTASPFQASVISKFYSFLKAN